MLLTHCQPINHKTINLRQIPLGRLDGGQPLWKNEIHPKYEGFSYGVHVKCSAMRMRPNTFNLFAFAFNLLSYYKTNVINKTALMK